MGLREEIEPTWAGLQREAFLEFIQSIVRDKPGDFGESWEDRAQKAEATSQLDYGCNFRDGVCTLNDSSPQCCCRSCSSMFGYFYDIYGVPESALPVYEKLFEPELGFWRPEKGCILPRSLRSLTCLRYQCFPAERNAPGLTNQFVQITEWGRTAGDHCVRPEKGYNGRSI